MSLALPLPLSIALADPRAATAGLPWHGRVLGLVLSKLHAREIDSLVRAERVAVAMLYEAKNADDLDVILDEAVEANETREAVDALARLTASPLVRVASRFRPRESAWAALGPVASKVMALGATYATHAALAIAHLPKSELLAAAARPRDELRDLVYDVHTPVELSRMLLAIRRAPVCLFALGSCLADPKAMPSWMVIALAERFMIGQRASLCLLACVPGVSIPEDVLPPEDRLDLAALSARAEAQIAAWDALPMTDGLSSDEPV